MADVCDLVEDFLGVASARTDKTAAFTVESVLLRNQQTYVVGASVVEALALSDSAAEVTIGLFVDQLSLSSIAVQTQALASAVIEQLSFRSATHAAYRNLVSDAIGISNATSATVRANTVERIALSTANMHKATAVGTVVERLSLSDIVPPYMVNYVSVPLTLTGAGTAHATKTSLVSDSLAFVSSKLQTVSTSQLVVDRLSWSNVTTDSLSATQTVIEEIYLGNELYAAGNAAWTALGETWGMSRYAGLPFNSITEHNGAVFAAGPGGLYQIGGGTDDGEQIQAEVTMGVQPVAGGLSRAAYAYAGYSSDGAMALRVTGAPAGVPVSYLAKFEKIKAAFEVINRVKLGRGLRSAYFQFGILNQSGAGFRLDSLRIMSEDAKRKF